MNSTIQVAVSVNFQERAMFEVLAASEDMSVSAFLRWRIRKLADKNGIGPIGRLAPCYKIERQPKGVWANRKYEVRTHLTPRELQALNMLRPIYGLGTPDLVRSMLLDNSLAAQ